MLSEWLRIFVPVVADHSTVIYHWTCRVDISAVRQPAVGKVEDVVDFLRKYKWYYKLLRQIWVGSAREAWEDSNIWDSLRFPEGIYGKTESRPMWGSHTSYWWSAPQAHASWIYPGAFAVGKAKLPPATTFFRTIQSRVPNHVLETLGL
jgi:hypothetical protein